MLFHVRSAEIHESVRQSQVDFGRLAKLCYFHVDLVLLPRFEPPVRAAGHRTLRFVPPARRTRKAES